MSWVNKLKPGDVILFGNRKTPRVVLEVVRHKPRKHAGKLWNRVYITLTIQHCSWTTRPDTVYNGYELAKKAKPSKMKESLRSPIRRKLLRSISARNAKECEVRCWEVVGLP